MLSSTVEQVKLTVSDQVKKFGYTTIALALRQLIHNGQRKLAAMIIVALCLAPRKTAVENSGVRRILRNISLWRLGKADNEFMYELRSQAEHSTNPNKVQITLVNTGWLSNLNFWPNNRNPWLQANDGCIYLNSRKDSSDREGFQHILCDHAGCQRMDYFPHFRMIWDEHNYHVRVIGKQFDRNSQTFANSKELSNGYREYLVPAVTVLYGFGDRDGRTLSDLLEPGVWYNEYFQPDKELDLVNHEAEKLAATRQQTANLAMKFGQLNG